MQADEPHVYTSNITVDQGIVNGGREGIEIAAKVRMTGMIGRKVGLWGYVTDESGKNVLAKGTWNDIKFIEKVESQNIPMLKTFVPIKLDAGQRYRAFISVYDYSDVNNPQSMVRDWDYFKASDMPESIKLHWGKLPTRENETLTVSASGSADIVSVIIGADMKVGGHGTNSATLTASSKYIGKRTIWVRVETADGKYYRQTRTTCIEPNVVVQNVKLIPNSYGGQYHRVKYQCKTVLPPGTKFGVKATISKVTGMLINSGDKDPYHYHDEEVCRSKMVFLVSEGGNGVSEGEILIPKYYDWDKDKRYGNILDENDQFITSVEPFIFKDDNWVIEHDSMFSTLYSADSHDTEPVFNVDNNGVTYNWIMCPTRVSTPDVQLKIGIKSPTKIESATFTVNGQRLRGVKVVKNDGYDMVLTETIALAEGTNEVCITTKNTKGENISRREIYRQPAKSTIGTSSRRAALVIGNAAYPGNELYNTTNDASDLATTLKRLGFDVMLINNGTKSQMDRMIEQFAAKAALMEASYFFYAGHAVQCNGNNYLIPVDAKISSVTDIPHQCVTFDDVINKLDHSGCGIKILSLDACRNNPFGSHGNNFNITPGLSRLNSASAIGTFVSFATSPGSVASDGSGRNSPYTSALLSTLNIPGLNLDQVFNKVGSQVVKTTNNQQQPWTTKSVIEGEFYFNRGK